MSAELRIHAFTSEQISSQTIADFNTKIFGSRHFDLFRRCDWDGALRKLSETPSVSVGDVSWLKAALTGDAGAYVPGAVRSVSDLIGHDDPVLIDEALIANVWKAMGRTNTTGYATTDQSVVIDFLQSNKGKLALCISW